MGAKELCERVLDAADVKVNGDRPWDIRVHDAGFYDRVVGDGTLGLGESYMDGWWDCDALDEMMARALRAGGERAITRNWRTALHVLRAKAVNLQTRRGAREVARRHYDIDDELYMSFLDPYDQYTCAYFKDAAPGDLDRAQRDKMDLICRKLRIGPDDRVLDVGCGWGGLARWINERHGCRVTGINIAEGQLAHARAHARGPGTEFVAMDYRDLPRRLAGEFDKVVSVGMFEHVGCKNHRTFFESVRAALRPGRVAPGGRPVDRPLHLPERLRALPRAWPRFRERHGDRFFRMFRYSMLSCAGAFRARQMQLFQAVLSPEGVPGGYEAVR